MSVIPQSRDEMMTFYAVHAPIWAAVSASIGLSSAQTINLQEQVHQASKTLDDALAARSASTTATATLNEAAGKLRSTGGAMMAAIRAYAETTNDPGVYQRAQIPPPKIPQPLAPPVAPTNVVATLLASGAIEVEWDGTTAHGVTYMVYRRTDPGTGFGPLSLVGTIGARSLIDATLTGCIKTVGYQVRAVRGTAYSPYSAESTIRFTPAVAGPGVEVEAA